VYINFNRKNFRVDFSLSFEGYRKNIIPNGKVRYPGIGDIQILNTNFNQKNNFVIHKLPVKCKQLLSSGNVGSHDGGNEECFVPQFGHNDDGESCEESMQESIV
jgi:hypothetical protein